MELQIVGLSNFSLNEQAKVIDACKRGGAVVSSNLFKLAVMYAKMTETRGLSNQQIYDLILSGKDPLKNGSIPADGIIQIDLKGYFAWNNVVGFTYLRSYRTYFNRKFLRRFEAPQVLAHILHETCHRLNFTHTNRFSWGTSVPYTIGRVTEKVWEEYFSKDYQQGINTYIEAENKNNLKFTLMEIS